MGRVYAAYDPELDRRVAIKLVRPLHDAAGHEAASLRLMREGQLMARLSHPSVVAIYDVGALDDQVFLAMELIDGPDLARWLADGPRTWREVLAMYEMAGRGLAAAHAAGLVHRDFKPSNVIVANGAAKVGDFGLASPAGDDADDEHVVGTPRYMSPEQREGRAGPAADQYSFCRALTDGLASAQGTAPRAVRRVIERGLADDPAARWPSLDALLTALTAARRRRVVLAASAAGVGLAGAVTTALVLATARPEAPPPCPDDAAALAGAWDDTARATAAAAFARLDEAPTFTAIAAAVDAYATRWRTMHVDTCRATQVRHEQSAELMDLRFACLATRREELRALADQLAAPEPASLPALARAAHALTPLEVCASAAGLSAPTPLPADPAARDAIAAARATLASAHVLGQVGKYPPALAAATTTLEAARTRAWRPLIAEAALEAGMLSIQGGHPDDGERLLLDAAWFAEASRHDRAAAEAWTVLVFSVVQRGTGLERADEWARRADAAIERLGGDRDLRARLLNHQGAIAYLRGDNATARATWEQALAASLAFLPADHPDVARIENNLGIAADTAGDTAAAEAHYGRAIDAWTRALGPRHPLVGNALTNRGSLKRGRGDLDGAIADHRAALDILEHALGPEHPQLTDPLVNLGNALLARDDVDQAIAAFERALALRERALGPRTPPVANVLASLGAAFRQGGDYQRSLEVLERALSIQRETLPPEHGSTAITRTAIGETLLSSGQAAAARPHFEAALHSFEAAYGRKHATTAYALAGLARCHNLLNHGPAGVVMATEVVAIREPVGDAVPLAEARMILARALWYREGAAARPQIEQLIAQARPHLKGRLDADVDPARLEAELQSSSSSAASGSSR